MRSFRNKACVLILVSAVATGLALGLLRFRRASSSSAGARDDGQPPAPANPLEARERSVDATTWAKEILAQQCALTFESLWDSLNEATDKLAVAASFPVGQLVAGQWSTPETLRHGIESRQALGPGPTLSAEGWRRLAERCKGAGWELERAEFRHNRFETDGAGRPARSHFYFSAHLTNPGRAERAIVEGDMVVDWAAPPTSERPAIVKQIDASHLTIKTHRGQPGFQLILNEQITPPERSAFIDPLILYDLDGDGLSEIILAARNLFYRRRGADRYESKPLCRHPPGLISSAVVADFDGDGAADLLCAESEGLALFSGSPQGTFDQPSRLAWRADPPLKYAQALTCGDVDRDGDLDVFVGQYRLPTLGQVLRPNYYDARDGYPAHLLLNDGHGRFIAATAAAGLGQKGWRRTYSASFVDLDDDGNLDLLLVNDFAGLDLYRNDGRGRFTDVTARWVADSRAFGMSQALADFNADGRLDVLMIGMNSPTADRLEHLGLTRPGTTEDPTMRRRMTYGNRLYLAQAGGGFAQTALNDSIAHTGWSWGCSAFDFDNDAFPDVYIANGQQSKQSVRDYEAEFWLHDIYIGDSVDDRAATDYFLGKYSRTRGQGWSYGGYEKNRLCLNRRGESFVEIGHLMGVALEEDSRNVVADDLDGDGRIDLVVTTFEVWPEQKQTLRVYKNTLSSGGNWVGFKFRERAGSGSPVGVRVALRANGHGAVRQLVTGDSFRSQHPTTAHFGLGEAGRVESVEVRWPDGQVVTLREPAVNCYHCLQGPPQSRARN